MDNKVLIKLVIPELDDSFDLFIPVNVTIYKLKNLLYRSLEELCGVDLLNKSSTLINKINSRIYQNDEIVINTDIRNASELLLIFNK
mgnify:CR=1 FL=1